MAEETSDRTFWGRLASWGPYHAMMRLATASPRRQFVVLAAFPILWILTQHLGPMLQMLRVSLTDAYPVAPGVEQHFTLENYARFFGDSIFWMPFFRTLIFAGVFTFCTLIITYPVAYFLARHVSRKNQMLFLLLLLIPFWVGEIVRTYAIMILLGNTGAVNLALKTLGLIDRPIPFMYTSFSMGVGIVYLTALYMLLPLYSALEKLPKSMNEAAADLGAGAWTRFRRVSLPLTIEGISSGCTLVFLISTGFYATPVLLGGPSTTVFAETIAGFFHVAGDEWPTGAAFATIMFMAALIITTVFQKLMNALRKGEKK
ncbi:spermidine/putrescine ABC transporter permease [Mameliella alba]|uniref:ABC transporter, membrane spanning protein n=2 Tax=Roseobacteraceae TaxID=2854170 RepID=A0A0B3SJD1_9RHOB|nr:MULTISPECIES: ABC transporter permease [Mameliella]MCR9275401.1 ABC transporter permease [Paracoccaceae bacterium]MDD9732901.1 ABC transporter permease [Mameliella sp. AT18]KHQ50669.1 ABC transporter, membrane spanning protein [Mameliella alba]PTR35645.1 spermidine/putrescine transport system permease protein [Mameliella alba]SDE16667.1 spermidine/putrescine transport system permease protein [Mameliella alba]